MTTFLPTKRTGPDCTGRPLDDVTTASRLSSLTAARQRLVRLMQQINFGRIENLRIRAGEPVFDPSLHIVREVKLGADTGSTRQAKGDDFELKSQVRELLAALSEIGDGVVKCIEVRHGLPFRMVVAEALAEGEA